MNKQETIQLALDWFEFYGINAYQCIEDVYISCGEFNQVDVKIYEEEIEYRASLMQTINAVNGSTR